MEWRVDFPQCMSQLMSNSNYRYPVFAHAFLKHKKLSG